MIDFYNIPAIAGGGSYGTDDLQPLIGGCSGGGFNNAEAGDNFPEGSAGGGAIQISSRGSITVHGTVDASGSNGAFVEDGQQTLCGGMSPLGGGSGGAILLEAPVVSLAATAILDAHGGDGAGCSPATQTCGLPGHGTHGVTAGTAGGDTSFVTALGDQLYAPGTGAGGVGRVRINTRTGNYSGDSASKLDGIVTTSILKTR
ncbi:MAG: hypothetical protein ABJE66_38205 [Deltaproteobacteria bacterium]